MKRFWAAAAIAVAMVAPGLAGATENFVPDLNINSEAGKNCADYGDGSSGDRVQIVYAHDSSQSMSAADQFKIEQAVYVASLLVSDSADGTDVRRLRYVHPANDCAPTIIDMQVPTNLATATDPTAVVWNYGDNTAGYNATNYPNRKFAYFIETGGGNGGPCVAPVVDDDSDSPANTGDDWNHVGLPDQWSAQAGYGCWDGQDFLHELSHTMAAFSTGAPGSGAALGDPSHSIQYEDVIFSNKPGTTPCPVGSTATDFGTYDCLNDSYFDTQPESGEWLETHRNLADSSYFFTTDNTAAPCRVYEEPDILVIFGNQVWANGAIVCDQNRTVYTSIDQKIGGVWTQVRIGTGQAVSANTPTNVNAGKACTATATPNEFRGIHIVSGVFTYIGHSEFHNFTC